MSASEEVKKEGIKSLAHACKVANIPANTAFGWYQRRPRLFKVFVLGVAELEKREAK